ncbi:MAG: TVP38/TMEM64 family protein [Planctomycetota bacterium]
MSAQKPETATPETATTEQATARGGLPVAKILVFALLVAGIGLGIAFREQLSFAALAEQEAQLRAFQQQNPVAVYGIAFLVYVLVTGLSLPGAAALTLVYGWLFGLVPGLILVSFASTTGATVAFLTSRYLLRDYVQDRFGGWLTKFNDALEREGAFYLFTLRLVVAVPFFVINLVMGLTPLRTSTFWWVSQVGMLPGTAVFVYAGSTVPTLAEIDGPGSILSLQTILAFAVLGVFPLVIKKLVARLRPKAIEEGVSSKANGAAV